MTTGKQTAAQKRGFERVIAAVFIATHTGRFADSVQRGHGPARGSERGRDISMQAAKRLADEDMQTDRNQRRVRGDDYAMR